MTGDATKATADEIKACCAALYASDWARLLLGASFHPGGLALTERLGTLLNLGPADRVLDVAAGHGTSALHLAERFGCSVVGVDYSAANVELAQEAARAARLDHRVRFVQGDAERLVLPSASVDALICECALCTFPNKTAAASEFRRVVRPGGRVGISDVTRAGALPPDFDDLLAHVACIAAALPTEGYVGLLGAAGFEINGVEPHGEALRALGDDVRARLLGAQVLAAMSTTPTPFSAGDLSRVQQLARSAVVAIQGGQLGYVLITGSRPAGSCQPEARDD